MVIRGGFSTVAALLLASGLTLLATNTEAAAQRVIVPAFAFSGADWTTMTTGAPTASTAVFDIGMGSGNLWGASYAAQRIQSGHGRGMKVLGYVPTANGRQIAGRTEADVKGYVDGWYQQWPQIDGIFFDEGPVAPIAAGVQTFYEHIYQHVKSKTGVTGTSVLLNAAGFDQEWVMQTASDMAITWEDTAANYENGYAAPPWFSNYPASRFVHVVHTCADCEEMASIVALSKQRNAGSVYVYDGTSAAYDRLPKYWKAEVLAVAGVTVNVADYDYADLQQQAADAQADIADAQENLQSARGPAAKQAAMRALRAAQARLARINRKLARLRGLGCGP